MENFYLLHIHSFELESVHSSPELLMSHGPDPWISPVQRGETQRVWLCPNLGNHVCLSAPPQLNTVNKLL